MNFNFIKEGLIYLLDNSFTRPLLSGFFNTITKLKNSTDYSIYYDKSKKLWIHKKGKTVISIEDKPNYSISKKTIISHSISYFFKHYQIKPNDVIIDVGAGIGNDVFAIKENYNYNFNLYAFEAHPQTFEKLKYLVEMNSYKNVQIYQQAVVDVPKSIYISSTDNHTANRVSDEAKGSKVEGITIDNFVKNSNIKSINYIKFNIEGAETDALKGMKESLRITENIVVACHDKLSQYYNNDPHFVTFNDVKNILLDNNFTILEIEDSLYHITIYAQKKM